MHPQLRSGTWKNTNVPEMHCQTTPASTALSYDAPLLRFKTKEGQPIPVTFVIAMVPVRHMLSSKTAVTEIVRSFTGIRYRMAACTYSKHGQDQESIKRKSAWTPAVRCVLDACVQSSREVASRIRVVLTLISQGAAVVARMAFPRYKRRPAGETATSDKRMV